MKKQFLIVGAGGFGREALQVFRAMHSASRVRQLYVFGGFVDDNPDADVSMVPNAQLIGGSRSSSIRLFQSVFACRGMKGSPSPGIRF